MLEIHHDGNAIISAGTREAHERRLSFRNG